MQHTYHSSKGCAVHQEISTEYRLYLLAKCTRGLAILFPARPRRCLGHDVLYLARESRHPALASVSFPAVSPSLIPSNVGQAMGVVASMKRACLLSREVQRQSHMWQRYWRRVDSVGALWVSFGCEQASNTRVSLSCFTPLSLIRYLACAILCAYRPFLRLARGHHAVRPAVRWPRGG